MGTRGDRDYPMAKDLRVRLYQLTATDIGWRRQSMQTGLSELHIKIVTDNILLPFPCIRVTLASTAAITADTSDYKQD